MADALDEKIKQESLELSQKIEALRPERTPSAMKPGFLSSEFVLPLLTLAVTALNKKLGLELDVGTVYAMLGTAALYILQRYGVKALK